MDDEDYDILPHKEVMRLRGELGQKPTQQPVVQTDLKASVDALNASILQMIQMFQQAAKDMKDDKTMDSSDVVRKLDVLINHNEDMAKALLLLLELSREHLPKLSTGVKQQFDARMQQPVQAPTLAQQPRQDFSMPIGLDRSMPEFDIGLPEPPKRPMNVNPVKR